MLSTRKPRRTPEGEAFAKLAFAVLRLSGYLTAAGDALTKPLGQSSARWQVLAAASHGALSVAQVARVLGMSRQGVQRVADLLVESGLAEYQPNPLHKRAKLLNLLPKGQEILAEIRLRQAVWVDEIGKRFSAEDLVAVEGLLNQAIDALSEHDTP
ncbi:MarR family winged helix-turn-helix transcriptional regulator [Microvirga sp. M2]|uniref:MarR family winged helix-turn-helix transcriptional regulator n=1 Tax=Microvirga sp. M2 TaxID=3073270 RepID=UPI0039C38F8F